MRYKKTARTAIIVFAALIVAAVLTACSTVAESRDSNDNKDTAMDEFVNRTVFSEVEIETAKLL